MAKRLIVAEMFLRNAIKHDDTMVGDLAIRGTTVVFWNGQEWEPLDEHEYQYVPNIPEEGLT